jgi:hypothetical protein
MLYVWALSVDVDDDGRIDARLASPVIVIDQMPTYLIPL